MIVLKYCLLLALFNILTTVHPQSECDVKFLVRHQDLDYSCVKGNVTIYVTPKPGPNSIVLEFDCKGTILTYLKPLEHRRKQHVHLHLKSCSPSNIIGFLNEIYDKPNLVYVVIEVTNKILPTVEMDSLKTRSFLRLKLDGDTIIPINGTSSWSSLTTLVILGGHYLQLTEDPGANMTRLPADSFSGLKSLILFHIQDNKNIEIIGADALRGLNKLQILKLLHSKLKYLEVDAFEGVPTLRYLDLSNNLIESLLNGLFQSLKYIVAILLHGNHLKVIDSHAFSNLPTLKLIYIENCTITSLPENIFTGSYDIEMLNIRRNNMKRLPSEIFRDQHYLETLLLGHNRMRDPRNFNVFYNLKTLKYLDLSFNKIYRLPKSLFLELNNLEKINLSNNYIKSITKELIDNMRDIHLLMKYDKIENLPYGGNPFRFLTQLRSLDLASNQIQTFDFGQFEDMQPLLHLEYLNLSRNQITYEGLSKQDFTNSQITIDLSYNKISSLNDPGSVSSNNNGRVAKSTIILNGNPMNCDCYSYGLYLGLNGAYDTAKPNYIFHSDCFSPSNLKGKRLKDISPKLLICDYTYANCLKTCNSCIVVETELIMDCRETPSLNLSNNYIYQFVDNITVNMKNQPKSLEDLIVNKLNLTNAGIQSLTFIPNYHLKIIDVTHNNIRSIPDIFSKGNYTMYLSNNPFECDCEFVKNMFALHERNLLPDYNEMTCANGDKVAQIDINELCSRSIRLITLIGRSTIGSFVALVIVIKLYLNAHKIWMNFLKLFCKRKYERTRIEMREIGIETAKVYDLFISYAHQDENFVAETLLPKLENEFNQKVCVHIRDWIVGNVIASQIIESVENSRRTVIILSEHFLMSEWSEVEFHTAHTWSIQEGKPRIIIILLKEEVARDERMGAELKSYVASNTYLLWGDPLFWEKFQKVLPGKIPKYIW